MADDTTTFDDIANIAIELTEEAKKPLTEVIYKDGDLIHLSPFKLQITEWNPRQRTDIREDEKSAMGVLLGAIMRFRRVLVPVIIDDCGNLIEGNRRVAATQWLMNTGLLPKDFTLPCHVVKIEGHPSGELFAYINRARQQINGSVLLEIYDRNQDAVVDEKKAEANYFLTIMGGTEKLREFVKAGGKASNRKAIETVATFTGLNAYTVGMWLVRKGLAYRYKKLLKAYEYNQKTLIYLIKNNKYPK
jgi:hypothetical protein